MRKNTEKWAMLPKVKHYSYQDGYFILDAIAIKSDTDEAIRKVLHTALGEVSCCDEKINLALEETELGEEEYKLRVTREGIQIQYGSRRGLFHAATTLKQLRKHYKEELRCLELWDYPDIPVRGILYDISRNKVPKLETLYLLADMMADLKYNQLQLYVEGLSFEYEKFSQYLEEDSYIKKSEILCLQEYCKERFIELVPNQNTLGHMADWLKTEEFSALAKNPQGETAFGKMQPPATLDPERKESETFIESLTEEMLPLYESRYYNVNLDETFGITEPDLYRSWLWKMHGICKKQGKKMMMWSDMVIHFADGLEELPEDIILLDWGYEDVHPFDTECSELKRRNLEFYLCPGTSAWCSLAGRTGNMLRNVDKAVDCAHRYGAKGMLMTDWGDGGHWQAFPISWPGFVYAAARAWNKASVSGEELSDYLSDFIFEDSGRQMGRLSLVIGNLCRYDDFRLLNGSMFYHQLVIGLCSKEKLEAYIQELRNWMIPFAGRFYQDGGRELIEQIESRQEFDYDGIMAEIEEMRTMLMQADPKRKDGLWTKSEYEQTLLLLELAAKVRRYIEQASYMQGEEGARRRSELKGLVQLGEELFMKNWRNRNKESNLIQSTGMFDKIRRQIAQLEVE